MKHLFILNPKAGHGQGAQMEAEIAALCTAQGLDVEIYHTVGPMDAAEKTKREALKGRPLRVYACGGDGTLSECVHGAVGYSNCAVTHYPLGTGNDFIKSFPGDTALFRSLPALLEGQTLPLDVIDVNGRRAIDIVSVGIDARVGTDVHKYSHLPLLGGKNAYTTSLVVNLFKGIHREMTLTMEDRTLQGKLALACVCNGSWYGGGYHPSKLAVPDDGLLEIVVVGKVSLFALPRLLADYAKGDGDQHPAYCTAYRGRKLTIEAPQEFVVNVDGEALTTKKATLRLLPRAVNFLFPKGSTFLAERIGQYS